MCPYVEEDWAGNYICGIDGAECIEPEGCDITDDYFDDEDYEDIYTEEDA